MSDKKITATKTENDGRQWYSILGIYDEPEMYGVDDDGKILDSDGVEITADNSWEYYRVLRAINNCK